MSAAASAQQTGLAKKTYKRDGMTVVSANGGVSAHKQLATSSSARVHHMRVQSNTGNSNTVGSNAGGSHNQHVGRNEERRGLHSGARASSQRSSSKGTRAKQQHF